MATSAARMLTGDDQADEAVEYGNSKQASSNPTAAEFFMVLLQAAVVAHVLHLQTRSFAEHMALDTLYSELPGLTDTLIEAYQGKYGLVMDYPERPPLPAAKNCVAFVVGVNKYLDENRAEVSDDSEIQNLIDEIVTLFDSTTYKLKFLT